MADLKLSTLFDAIGSGALQARMEPFFPSGAAPGPATTRLQPPDCYWAVYAAEGRRATFKAFFSSEDFDVYVDALRTHYGDRIDRPDHPSGGLAFVPELNGVIWGFPFDPLMPSLHRCVDGKWVADAIHRNVPLVPRIVEYTPEIGATMAYADPDTGRTVAYGKASPKESCALIYMAMSRLWRSQARRDGVLCMPKPLAFRPEADLLLQARVYGKPLHGDRNREVFRELATAAGSSLAAVHTADIPFGPERGLEELLGRVEWSIEETSHVSPPTALQLRKLLAQLRERAARSRPEALVPSHGDFKYDQLLKYRRRFVLIDFELFCRAEPALDLGTFCAYLPPSRPVDWRDGAAAETLRADFLRTYARTMGRGIDFERLALYEAAMLAIRALGLVAGQRDDWPVRAGGMLDLALERLVAPEGVFVT